MNIDAEEEFLGKGGLLENRSENHIDGSEPASLRVEFGMVFLPGVHAVGVLRNGFNESLDFPPVLLAMRYILGTGIPRDAMALEVPLPPSPVWI